MDDVPQAQDNQPTDQAQPIESMEQVADRLLAEKGYELGEESYAQAKNELLEKLQDLDTIKNYYNDIFSLS